MGGFCLMGFAALISCSASLLEYYNTYRLSQWASTFGHSESDWSNWFKYSRLAMFYIWLAPIRTVIIVYASVSLSRRLHGKMVYSLLHSSLDRFIDRVPVGRILNRFTGDLQTVDIKIPTSLFTLVYQVGEALTSLLWFVIVLGPAGLLLLAVMYYLCLKLQRRYMQAKREFIRQCATA